MTEWGEMTAGTHASRSGEGVPDRAENCKPASGVLGNSK